MNALSVLLEQEAQRRLALLGPLATAAYDYQRLRQRSRDVFVPVKVLWEWWRGYQEHRLAGLFPTNWNLNEITAKTQVLIDRRLRQLEPIRAARVITPQHLHALAARNSWSMRTTERWVRRYQVAGWWGLAPTHDPEKAQRPSPEPLPPALGALDEAVLDATFRRRTRLGKLAKQPVVSRTDIARQAAKNGVAERTLWHDLQRYRQAGLAGLVPKSRADKGTHHKITDEMVEVVQGVRFSQAGNPVRAVHETVCQMAEALGEVAPSRWQVRQICAQISPPERLLADGREDLFRNWYETTRSLEGERQRSKLIVYQIDPTRVKVLVKDLRKPSCRSKSGAIRPWLTLCLDSRSRLVLAAIFTYDHPDRYTIAAVIRDAVLAPYTRPYGGTPHEIWIDRGKELLSHHVKQLTQELQIALHKCHRHRPQEKGLVERFFRTLNTRFWSTQPGYVGSNVVERNPHVRAVLTMQELEQRFWAFIERYHQEVHSQTHETPRAYWRNHCYAEPPDPRVLDILLMEPKEHKVLRVGIRYENRFYWEKALARLNGSWVTVRAKPHYQAPDEIEVFLKKGNEQRWLCTAKANDTPEGQAVTRDDLVAAKQDQKAFLHQNIRHARAIARTYERRVAALAPPSPEEASVSVPDQPSPVSEHPPSAGAWCPTEVDVLDVMARQHLPFSGEEQ